MLHGTAKSASTPVSPTLHSRAATPPPASASTSAIAIPKPKRSWLVRHAVASKHAHFASPISRGLRACITFEVDLSTAACGYHSRTFDYTCSYTSGRRAGYAAERAPTPHNAPTRVPSSASARCRHRRRPRRDAYPSVGWRRRAAVDEEPPEYSASEKAAGVRLRLVSVSTTNTATAQSTV